MGHGLQAGWEGCHEKEVERSVDGSLTEATGDRVFVGFLAQASRKDKILLGQV